MPSDHAAPMSPSVPTHRTAFAVALQNVACLNTQCRRGSAIGSGGAAVRPWQWEPQWGSPVLGDFHF